MPGLDKSDGESREPTLEARVTEYHIRKAIRNIFRMTSFFRGGHGANFDVRRRSWKTIEWFDGRMSCVQRGSHRSQPNRANLKCRGIFATAPLDFHMFSQPDKVEALLHIRCTSVFSAPNINQNLLPNKVCNRLLILSYLTLQWLADNYPPASSRSPRDHPRNSPR